MFSIREVKSKETFNNVILNSAIADAPMKDKLFLSKFHVPYPKGNKVTVDGKEMMLSSVKVQDGIIRGTVVESKESTTGIEVELPAPKEGEGITTGVYFGRVKGDVFIPIAMLELDKMRYYHVKLNKYRDVRCMKKYLGDNPSAHQITNYIVMYLNSEIFHELMREELKIEDKVYVDSESVVGEGIVKGYPEDRTALTVEVGGKMYDVKRYHLHEA